MVQRVVMDWYGLFRRAIYLTLILTGYFTSCHGNSEKNFVCPEQFGYYADMEECSKYFVCVFGDALHESCTGGLYFSAELQTCDWPRNVECASGVKPSATPQHRSAQGNNVFDSNRQRSVSPERTLNSNGNQISQVKSNRSEATTTTTTTTQAPTTTTTYKSLYKPKQNPSPDDTSLYEPDPPDLVDPYDPQAPQYEEAVPPIIDSEGGIHVVDGPIESHGSVVRIPGVSDINVFVKPIFNTDKNERTGRGGNHRVNADRAKVQPPLSSNNGHSKDPDLPPLTSNNGKSRDPDVHKTHISILDDYTDTFEATRKRPTYQNRQPRLYDKDPPSVQYEYPDDYNRKNLSSTKAPTVYTDYDTSPVRGYSDYYGDEEYETAFTKVTTRGNPTITVTMTSTVSTPTEKTFPSPRLYPSRPKSLYSTPQPLSPSVKCEPRNCMLPDCRCGGIDMPGGLTSSQVPQIVLLTFNDAINDLNYDLYKDIFLTGRKNPNGCPILGTFYVSHEWTDYGQVQTLYSQGHEMASHSITHSYGEKFSKSQWFKEIQGQREILNKYGGVKIEDIRGMRAPFLQIGGNKMFDMLYEANFTYDASMPVFENNPPFWPYTLDYSINHECMIAPCPTKSYPGMWELGLVMWLDLRGNRCSMADACSNPQDEDGIVKMLMKNFNRHYKNNRAPFGLFYHSAWFNTQHHRRGFLKFLDKILDKQDVWLVTNWQLIQWMRNPTPLDNLANFEPWQCGRSKDLPAPCPQPTVCSVWYQGGVRYMKTCQPCPTNYPWVTPDDKD